MKTFFVAFIICSTCSTCSLDSNGLGNDGNKKHYDPVPFASRSECLQSAAERALSWQLRTGKTYEYGCDGFTPPEATQ